jgi:23S rRNA (uridine2552-2'-O)-methyltransferase
MARYDPHDKFFRQARERGLPSRAAFKIEELIARFRLVRPGARVLDLGCAPGGWLVVLAAAAGLRGRVVGVDLAPCRADGENVITLAGDLREPAIREAAITALGGPADLITSDLAPKLSGIAEHDQARTIELLESALAVARDALKPEGTIVAKLFMGGGFAAARALFLREFVNVEVARTRASRPGSAELYVVARKLRGKQ